MRYTTRHNNKIKANFAGHSPTCQEAECSHKGLLSALQQRILPLHLRHASSKALPRKLPVQAATSS
jgi:hypothetical protein